MSRLPLYPTLENSFHYQIWDLGNSAKTLFRLVWEISGISRVSAMHTLEIVFLLREACTCSAVTRRGSFCLSVELWSSFLCRQVAAQLFSVLNTFAFQQNILCKRRKKLPGSLSGKGCLLLVFHQYTNKLSEHTNLIITQTRLSALPWLFSPPSAGLSSNNDSANLYSFETALCQRQRKVAGANPQRWKAFWFGRRRAAWRSWEIVSDSGSVSRDFIPYSGFLESFPITQTDGGVKNLSVTPYQKPWLNLRRAKVSRVYLKVI